MPSPFPGMDPYLERPGVFHDFHQSYVPALRDQLAAQVAPKYFVRLDLEIYVQETEQPRGEFIGRPDFHVREGGARASLRTSAKVALLEPEDVTVETDAVKHSVIKVIDALSMKVVTTIEILSPTNKKAGKPRRKYLRKRERILESNTHLVEIDLLRGYRPMPMSPLLPSDYRIFLSRASARPNGKVWRFGLRDRIPNVPVPLKGGDPDATLDLMADLHRVFDGAHYGDYIYAQPPEPPLTAEDATWAKEVLAKASRGRAFATEDQRRVPEADHDAP